MLTKVLPFLVYLMSFPLMFATAARVEIGLYFFLTFVPVIAVMKKITELPGGNNVVDGFLLAMIIGWFSNSSRESKPFFTKAPENTVVMLVILGSLINLIRGYTYMGMSDDINLVRLMAWKNYMILPVLYFVTVNNVDDFKQVRSMIICIVISLIGMDFNFYSTFRWIRAEHYSHSIRISGPFSFLGPNEVGAFFAMYTFLLIGIFYYLEEKKLKYAVLFVIACNFYPILFSYSRAAYISTVAGFIALGILKDRRVFFALFVVIIGYRILLPNSVVERIDMTFLNKGDVSASVAQSSEVDIGGVSLDTVGRKELWDKAKEYFYEQPIIGIGFDTFRHREGMITHSMYMKILAEQGMLGMSIFILFMLVLIRQAYRLFKKSTEKFCQGIGLGFLLCIVAHLAGSISGDESLYYNLMAIFWIFMGLVASLNQKYVTDDLLDVQPAESP
ncbi:O-antigen ligase family protein [Geobacter hydrogenophilus]|uniref:O-antigen ligase-related domain-containing protein n=1 Tax=Geobacter hydrogenophilus TaxID=40983 RepID=A0A9W6LCX7_9BACT|nr:O-antigen ligase family protein [Geobacter hydrogenophilus]MBT0892928.1 O-antigen ligase family protein [Geobacter hydrogenophilus]GLI39238.1 hypothetical protein GHYDROH2_27390 [Geobacter hydrogenophilus]